MHGPDRVVAGAGFGVRHLTTEALHLAAHAQPAYIVVAVVEGEVSATVAADAVTARAGESLLLDPAAAHTLTGAAAELLFVELAPRLFEELLIEIGWWRAGTLPVFRARVVED